MRIELTEKQKQYQKEFKEFVEIEIRPYACQWDKEERLDLSIIRKLALKGYLCAMLPQNIGGLGLDSISIGLLNEEIGKVCTSTRSILTVHDMVAFAIFRWGTEEQKDFWLPKMIRGEIIGAFGLTEPNIGCDAKNIETKAELINNHYMLKGEKKWVTLGQVADLYLIFAQFCNKPTAFLVEKNSTGFSVEPMLGLIGSKASMIAKLNMENCEVPSDNILGSGGTGLTHVAMAALDYGRYTIAWGCVGLAQECLDESLKYCRKRKQFGVPLRQHELIQKMITEMVVDLKAARLLCLSAGYLRDVGDPESIMETWNAKYFSSKIANSIASKAVQIHGANGCFCNYPVERYYRDAKIYEIIEGTSQMHEILIATNAFRGTF